MRHDEVTMKALGSAVTDNDDTVPQNAARENSPLVFVVDDDRDTVTTLSTILLAEGYSVFGIYKGSDVLPSMRIHKPDALILDIDLPGPSGYALAREIREEYGHHAPLLIALSGKWIGQTDQMLGQLAGFDHYCLKPCEPQQLLKLLRRLQDQRK